MAMLDIMNASRIQSWTDDSETSQQDSYEISDSLGAEVAQDILSPQDMAVIDEESDYEEDYTGGWLYVGH